MSYLVKAKCYIVSVIMLLLLFTSSTVLAKTVLPNTNSKMPGTNVTVYESEIPGYFKYINGRYAFSIDFPNNFTLVFLPANSDGARFMLPDGSAELTVSGGHNILGDTINDYYIRELQRIKGEIGYSEKGDSWFVVTWKQDGKIFYRKQFVSNLYQNSLTLSYPEEQKEGYDEIVTNIERTFIPGWKTRYKIWG